MPVRKQRTKFKYHPNFVQLFELSAKEAADRLLRVEAEKLTRELKEAILGQKYDWYPLDPEYLRRKIRDGFDPRILIRTKQYVESMQVYGPEDSPHGVIYRVDIPKDDEHNSGLPFSELARIMEFGRRDGKKPYARPHWRPTWGIYVRDLPLVTSRLKSEILTDFRQRLNDTTN